MAIKYIPDGVHTITPYLTVSDAAALLDFILRGLDDVKTIHEMKGADGTIWHADLKIGDTHLMLGQARKPEDALHAMCCICTCQTETQRSGRPPPPVARSTQSYRPSSTATDMAA